MVKRQNYGNVKCTGLYAIIGTYFFGGCVGIFILPNINFIAINGNISCPMFIAMMDIMHIKLYYAHPNEGQNIYY
jgi:hypothetical protein